MPNHQEQGNISGCQSQCMPKDQNEIKKKLFKKNVKQTNETNSISVSVLLYSLLHSCCAIDTVINF